METKQGSLEVVTVRTNRELVAWAISKIGCGYVFGANGETITEAFIQAKAALYPKQYTSGYIASSRRWIGKIAYDCGGLIDAFLGVDLNANGYYTKSVPNGNIGTIPDVPGILVFMTRLDGSMYHVGVYIGNGEVVEARGVTYGVVRTALSERGWDYWGKCHLVDYSTAQEVQDVIQKGDRDNGIVRCWQEALLKLGFDIGEDGADDWFGGDTEIGTKEFQSRFGLPQTGIVDAMTAAKMFDALRLIPNVDVKTYNDQIGQLTLELNQMKDTLTGQIGTADGYRSELVAIAAAGKIIKKYEV